MLDGKTVIVTGAAQGMGRRHLETCVAQGARVVATDLQDERLQEIVDSLGKDAVAVAHDVTDPDGWDRVVATAIDHFGAVNGLVNNAAIYFGPAPIDQESFETFETHGAGQPVRDLVGHQQGDRTHAPGGRRLDRQRVVDGGHDRHGRLHLLRHVQMGRARPEQDARPTISGRRASGSTRCIPEGSRRRACTRRRRPRPSARSGAIAVALRRPGTVDEVSALVTFLLSDASSYITGVEHVIDGGSILG